MPLRYYLQKKSFLISYMFRDERKILNYFSNSIRFYNKLSSFMTNLSIHSLFQSHVVLASTGMQILHNEKSKLCAVIEFIFSEGL